MKNEPPDRLLGAARRVLAGQFHVSENVVANMLARAQTGPTDGQSELLASLTDRELEVFRLSGEGHSTRDVALRLGVSPKTIEAHVAHIKKKLHVRTGRELVCLAAQWVGKDG